MNLHSIAAGVVSAVNPLQPVIVQVSTGYGTNPDGSRVPQYAAPFTAIGDVQQLSTQDLRHLDGLNIQGSTRAVYLNGEVDAIRRINRKGGDLVTLKDNTVWLTTHVLEQWPDWCKIAVTLQNQAQALGAPTPMWTHEAPAPVGGAPIGAQEYSPAAIIDNTPVAGTPVPMWPHDAAAPVGGAPVGTAE